MVSYPSLCACNWTYWTFIFDTYCICCVLLKTVVVKYKDANENSFLKQRTFGNFSVSNKKLSVEKSTKLSNI